MSERETEWADLMRGANSGDQDAYARFLRSIAGPLRALVRRALVRAGLPDADAEDIVQETLLAIHLKRRTWDPERPIMPWVQAIARYKLVDSWRRRGSRKHIPIDEVADVLPGEAADPPPIARDIAGHLPSLPRRQRDVVRAIAIEGHSIAEVATKLGMSQGAVRVALHRALTALAAKIRST